MKWWNDSLHENCNPLPQKTEKIKKKLITHLTMLAKILLVICLKKLRHWNLDNDILKMTLKSWLQKKLKYHFTSICNQTFNRKRYYIPKLYIYLFMLDILKTFGTADWKILLNHLRVTVVKIGISAVSRFLQTKPGNGVSLKSKFNWIKKIEETVLLLKIPPLQHKNMLQLNH